MEGDGVEDDAIDVDADPVEDVVVFFTVSIRVGASELVVDLELSSMTPAAGTALEWFKDITGVI
jgi:hypothetical protein